MFLKLIINRMLIDFSSLPLYSFTSRKLFSYFYKRYKDVDVSCHFNCITSFTIKYIVNMLNKQYIIYKVEPIIHVSAENIKQKTRSLNLSKMLPL